MSDDLGLSRATTRSILGKAPIKLSRLHRVKTIRPFAGSNRLPEDFELWKAKERRAKVETLYDETNTVMERVKTRATSLLSLTVTLTTGSLVAASQSRNHAVAAYVAALGFFVSSSLCVRALYSTKWYSKGMMPQDFDALFSEGPESVPVSEIDGHNRIADETRRQVQHNTGQIVRTRPYLRWAQKVAVATPVLSALLVFLVWCGVPLLIRQALRHMIESKSGV